MEVAFQYSILAMLGSCKEETLHFGVPRNSALMLALAAVPMAKKSTGIIWISPQILDMNTVDKIHAMWK